MSVAVLFVIDCTGSMEVIHRYLGKSLAKIIRMFEDEHMPVQFAAIGFRDHKAREDTAFEFVHFDRPLSTLEKWLNNVESKHGGSNFGESSLAAMVHGARSVAWPEEVKRRVLAVFTDDGPHVPDYGVDSWSDAHQQLIEEEVEQVHLFTVPWKIDRYDDLDGPGYVVIRHTLAKDGLKDFVEDELEVSIRDFVKVSSSGNFGANEIISRDDAHFESNPFDMDEDDDDLDEADRLDAGASSIGEREKDDLGAFDLDEIDWDDID